MPILFQNEQLLTHWWRHWYTSRAQAIVSSQWPDVPIVSMDAWRWGRRVRKILIVFEDRTIYTLSVLICLFNLLPIFGPLSFHGGGGGVNCLVSDVIKIYRRAIHTAKITVFNHIAAGDGKEGLCQFVFHGNRITYYGIVANANF